MDKLGKALLVTVLVILLASFLTTSVAFGLPAQARSPVRNVDTGSSYATIQEALNAAATLNGHTIEVEAGVYYENVVVDKSVSLIGENKLNTIIDARASGDVIKITADGVNITGLTMQNSMLGCSGVYICNASGNNVSQNIIRNDYDGIYVYGSNDNDVVGNEVFGNKYGIHLYGSDNNNVSDNNAYGNMNGIHLDVSSNNALVGNRVWSNTGNGVYLYGSADNNVSDNNVFSNLGRGIRLHYSSGNTLFSNLVSSNGYGIYLYGSADNVLGSNNASFNNESGVLLQGSSGNLIIGNILSINMHGIWLIDSNSNAVSGNNVSSNSEYGARFWNSSSNVFFHNNLMKNLVKNVEQLTAVSPTGPNTDLNGDGRVDMVDIAMVAHAFGTREGDPRWIQVADINGDGKIDMIDVATVARARNDSILNVWDDGAEGNYWDDYDGAVINMKGIGDKPYVVDPHALGVYSRDGFPLMGQFFRFNTAIESLSYAVDVVSNSTVTEFRYDRGKDNRTNAISFRVSGTNGTGFCLVCIPQFLIASPYMVTIDLTSSLSYDMARTNGTHTWIYFTYSQSGHEIVIKPILPTEVPIWHLWCFWWILGLVLSEAVLVSFAVKYHRKVADQARVIRECSPFVIAEALFKADIERRGLKIREFEKKYGVKIQPRSTMEDVIRSLEAKEKEEKS